ncbi:nucleotidyltransferase family protein [Patescibacteria group bacterium]|nr:nucleotidyltransferase family protein [Patescibacteria group bacterium]MBU4023301.1 nucleotidyltransferase family protein [Patescibacteria group bacterium]MBU4078150.1 nucleotidyltransferase family protein [Patescibacteria group bacterium]
MENTKKYPEVKTAIILAGGRGQRMVNFSVLPTGLKEQGFDPGKMHKSMIPVRGKPVLEHNILWLKNCGVKKIVIGVGYQKESIINYFEDGEKWDVEIIYAEHNPEGGTADAVKEDIKDSGINDDYFFVVNSDQLTSFPLKKLIEVCFADKILPIAVIGLVYPTFPFGKVEWNADTHRIISFQEKPVVKIPTSGGLYLFSREIQSYLKGDLEKYTFPILVKEDRIKGCLYKGSWDTINTIKDWQRINN